MAFLIGGGSAYLCVLMYHNRVSTVYRRTFASVRWGPACPAEQRNIIACARRSHVKLGALQRHPTTCQLRLAGLVGVCGLLADGQH